MLVYQRVLSEIMAENVKKQEMYCTVTNKNSGETSQNYPYVLLVWIKVDPGQKMFQEWDYVSPAWLVIFMILAGGFQGTGQIGSKIQPDDCEDHSLRLSDLICREPVFGCAWAFFIQAFGLSQNLGMATLQQKYALESAGIGDTPSIFKANPPFIRCNGWHIDFPCLMGPTMGPTVKQSITRMTPP